MNQKENRISLPETMTAENGAKAVLSGEFFVEVEHSCSACYFHGPQEDCEVCGGEVEWTQKHTIPWTTIKEIYKKIVKEFATDLDPEKTNG